MPANEAGNTATFTFLVPGGMLRNKDFALNIVAGKGTFKIPVPLSDAATWGAMLSPGQSIELRQVHLIQNSTGEVFGVSGLTTK